MTLWILRKSEHIVLFFPLPRFSTSLDDVQGSLVNIWCLSYLPIKESILA